MGEQRSPWARPVGGEDAAPVGPDGNAGDLTAWRAAAAATADPRWARASVAAERAGGASPWAADGSGDGDGGWGRGRHQPWDPWDDPAANGQTGSDPAEVAVGPLARAGDRPAAQPYARTPARGARRSLAVLVPPLVVLAGGAAVIGSTMTWATVRAYGLMEFAVRGTDPDQHGHLTMVLGLLAMVAGLLLAGRRVDWGRMLAVVAGLMLVLTAVVDLARLHRDGLLIGSGLDATTDIGPGLWVIGASGAVLLLAGVLVRFTALVGPGAPLSGPGRGSGRGLGIRGGTEAEVNAAAPRTGRRGPG
ncbi:hypothetical protein MXD63_20380 [Frankia sp. Cpl3]|uniref:hypothetical protein n=1 Tax=Parafrankia colletiae TaxID=573497 RepID=UPI000B0BA96C|nr:hypothetical protein [Parafrankia colletiae]MCK9902424.1 hypothetical protein [Frankia sp. Cpl3]